MVADRVQEGSIPVEIIEDSGSGPQTKTIDVPFVVSTEVSVEGSPGESRTLRLGTLVEPVIEPVLELAMTGGLQGTVAMDRYGALHGVATGVGDANDSPSGFEKSLLFNGADSVIDIAAHDALDRGHDIGYSLYIKPDALPTTEATLIAHDSRSSLVALGSDGRVRYRVETQSGSTEVVGPEVAIGQWHKVAAHYTDGQLKLEVNGALSTTPLGEELVSRNVTNAVRLGSGFNGRMQRFRVVDWSRPYLLSFPNGAQSINLTLDSAGKAQVELLSTAQFGQHRIQSSLKKSVGFAPMPSPVFVANVHGGTTSTKLLLVEHAEFAAGFARDFALGFLAGADVAGGNGAAIAGDILAGILGTGDLRDSVVQDIYLFTGNDRYNRLVHLLSSIGVLTTFAIVPSAAGGPAASASLVAIDSAVSAARVGASLYRANSGLVHHLVDYLTRMRELAKDGVFNELRRGAPFIQLFAAVAYMDDDTREYLSKAINSMPDLQAWIEYTAQIDDLFSTSTKAVDQAIWLDLLISRAEAAAILTKRLQDILPELSKYAKRQGGEFSETFPLMTTAAIKQLTQEIPGLASLTRYEQKTLLALSTVGHYGKEEGIELVLNAKGLLKGGKTGLLETISELDFQKLLRGMSKKQKEHFRKGFVRAVNHFGTSAAASRASHMMFKYLRQVQDEGGYLLRSVEEDQIIYTADGIKLGNQLVDRPNRVTDVVLRATDDGDEFLAIELKAWTKAPITLPGGRVIPGLEDRIEAQFKAGGQIYKDIVLFATEQGGKKLENSGVRWVFLDFADGVKPDDISDLYKLVEKHLKQNTNNIQKALGLAGNKREAGNQINKLVKEMKNKMFFETLPE